MSESGGFRRYGWTVATLLVAGLVIAFFIYTIANFLAYGFSSMLNVTVAIEEAGSQVSNTSFAKTSIKLGNYTAEVAQPNNTVMGEAFNYVFPLVTVLMKILTDPRLLAIVIAVTLIITALSLRGGTTYEW